jgi:H+-transporting ATPase
VPADSRVICDVNDEHGWEEFLQLQEQGMLGGGSESDEEDDSNKTEKEKDEDDGKAKAEDEHQAQKARRRGYPILACDHSAITGESLAVDRYMGDMIFYTTGCKRGKAYAVVQTGARTSFVGRTATMVQSAKGAGHFELVMDNIGTSLLILVMAWILAAWIGGFFRHIPIASPSQQTLLHYTLSLLIIGVPVGLPVVTTTTMAVGAAYLAKKKAIVQKLTAIESLAVSLHWHELFSKTDTKIGRRHFVFR